ncbi:putative phage abortive infection protein [Desulfovibrio intestinalis]|uniref:Phage abortive infection protein n=1 Tax=Desulfovibrio intestinalis TaxID=58621 RepID=A0A7W8C4J0_9BACT|nr:putative phage abortive infection protein [Desulfovibrio intestinalis]MBB5144179.1 hypothetical protein [Desulfovibrio intestinalis]
MKNLPQTICNWLAIKMIVFVLIVTIIIWALGIILLDAPAPNFWAKFFSNRDQLENLFSPIAAFFSGLSAIATAFLIYLQMSLIDRQERDTKKAIFENQIFQLFSMRTEIAKSLSYHDGERAFRGNETFEFFYHVMHCLYNTYIEPSCIEIKYLDKYKIKSNMHAEIDAEYGMLFDENGNKLYPDPKTLIKMALVTLENENKHLYSPFYHNVYTTLKMIKCNDLIDEDEKNNYLRIFRAQFSQYEFAIIYYHALVHMDKHENTYKFKKLIEDTCFFHSLADNFLFANITADSFPDYGYKQSAFTHKPVATSTP